MAPKQEIESEGTPFNMAMLYYIRLHARLNEKDIAANHNDLQAWYNSLKTIFRNIIFKLLPEEVAALEKEFLEVEVLLKNSFSSTGRMGQQMSNIFLPESFKKLDEIDKIIMQDLHNHDMIFPNIKGKGLALLDEKYGLGKVV